VLSFDVSRVSFLFILLGVFMFRRSGVTRTRDLGRVGIGLGLMLIALQDLFAMISPSRTCRACEYCLERWRPSR
jgi:phosphate:Na+ symporter